MNGITLAIDTGKDTIHVDAMSDLRPLVTVCTDACAGVTHVWCAYTALSGRVCKVVHAGDKNS